MALRYYATFGDLNYIDSAHTSGVLYRVNIYKDGYTGEAEEIVLDADSVNIEYAHDEIFKPTKLSECNIKIHTKDVMDDLYTGTILDVMIKIYETRHNGTQWITNLLWTGYNTPNIYNSPYSKLYDLTEVNAIDRIAALEYFKYDYINGESSDMASLYDIMQHCLEKVNADKDIMTIEYTNSLSGSNGNILKEIMVQERNWKDEEGEPATCLEVFEHICQFLGVTITQYKNKFIMREINSLRDGTTNTITIYNLNDNTKSIRQETVSAHTAVCAEDDCSVSLGDVYNQINVLANMVDVDETTFDVFATDTDLESLCDGEYYKFDVIYIDDDGDGESALKTNHSYYTKDGYTVLLPQNVTYNKELYYTSGITQGGFFMREGTYNANFIESWSRGDYRCYYPTQSSIDFKTRFAFAIGSKYMNDQWSSTRVPDYIAQQDGNAVLSKNAGYVNYKNGDYLILHYKFAITSELGYQLKCNKQVERPNNLRYYLYTQPLEVNTEENVNCLFAFKAQLRIGNKYWTGNEWTTTVSYFGFRSESRMHYNATYAEYDNSRWPEEWSIENTNDYTVKTQSDSNGWLIPITDDLYGDMQFTLYDCVWCPYSGNSEAYGYFYDPNSTEWDYKYIHVTELNLEYTPSEEADYYSIDRAEINDKDVKYSAVIDDDNVVEFSDITLYLNTFNSSAYNHLSYSYVYNTDMSYIQTVEKNGVVARPEEHIVQMYVDYYSTPRLIYENSIETDNIAPLDSVTVNYSDYAQGYYVDGKNFVTGSMTYDLRNDRINIKLLEL